MLQATTSYNKVRPDVCSGRLEDAPTMTNASWRLINWLSEYAELMLMLRSEASKIFCAMAQMYELYLLHVFYTFSSFNLADIMVQEQQQQVWSHANWVIVYTLEFCHVPQTIFCWQSLLSRVCGSLTRI